MSGPAPSPAAPGGPRGAALWVVAALAGGLHTASFAPTGAWYLQPAALALLAAATARAGVRHAALAGWVFGVAWLASGLWWLYISLHDFGHLAPPLAAAAVGLLAAFLALYPAMALAAWARWRPSGPAAAAAAFAAWWTLSELARGQWFTGFPWIAGGYAHTDGPWAGWAPWLGVYGLGALAAWAAAAVGLAVAGWRAAARDPERTERLGGARRAAARAAAVLLLPPLATAAAGPFLARDFTTGTGTLSVSLLQPAVPQDRKFDQAFIDAALAWHIDQIARAPGALVVSPESSLPLLPQQIDAEGWAGLTGPVSAPGRGALLGLFTGGPTEGWMNSMIGLSADSRPGGGGIYRYGKRHLLPFGEFIPPGFGWFVALLGIPIGDQVAGTVEAPFEAAGQRLRPLICYEDLFGEEIAGGVLGEGGATVLVNASNLAWFGTRMVQDQHLQFSRMRALEFQRPLVRSTNTGATAAIDHRGRVTARLPAAVEGRLDTAVEGRTGDTPFARWVHAAGLAPLWIAALGLLAALGWRERRRARR